jgi:hypothetical protein
MKCITTKCITTTGKIICALPTIEQCLSNITYGSAGLAYTFLGSELAVSILSTLPYVGIIIAASHLVKSFWEDCISSAFEENKTARPGKYWGDTFDIAIGDLPLLYFAVDFISHEGKLRAIEPATYVGTSLCFAFWAKALADLRYAYVEYRSAKEEWDKLPQPEDLDEDIQEEDGLDQVKRRAEIKEKYQCAFETLNVQILTFIGWTILSISAVMSLSGGAAVGFAFLAIAGLYEICKNVVIIKRLLQMLTDHKLFNLFPQDPIHQGLLHLEVHNNSYQIFSKISYNMKN